MIVSPFRSAESRRGRDPGSWLTQGVPPAKPPLVETGCTFDATRETHFGGNNAIRHDRQWQQHGWTGEPTGPPRLDGGRLCLDFANTVGWRESAHPKEFLTSYAVLITWAWYTGALSDSDAEHLRQLALDRPDDAASVHRNALSLRDTIYRLFADIARGQDPAIRDLDAVYRIYQSGLNHARIRRQDSSFAWEWPAAGDDLDRPLWPVAWSAVELLTSGELDRLKMCLGNDGDSCFWLFLDETKNRIRRWCNMRVCGTGAKARRQTARRRAARAATGSS